MVEIALEVIIGSLTFTGSLIAAGKLQELLPQRPITYRGQNYRQPVGAGGGRRLIALWLVFHPEHTHLFPVMVVVSLIFGVLLVTPIGGADMPTVISLLNSYAGLSAALLGFVLNNKVLVVAGALDGSSGFILSVIMCKAMNRSFTNVMFGAFGQVQASAARGEGRAHGAQRHGGRGRRHSGRRQHGGHRARLRHGGGAGAAQGARAVRRAHQEGRGREVRHPPRRRTHARPHERAAGRSRHSLRPPARDGRDQSATSRRPTWR